MDDLSDQQSEALAKIECWLRTSSVPLFRLFGFAGTGKTTIARYINTGKTLFAAYTGKAASVMQRKGCIGATTLHKLIYVRLDPIFRCRQHPDYIVRPDEEEQITTLRCPYCHEDLFPDPPQYVRNPQSRLAAADLLIVDECSMVDEELARDVLSFEKKVLVIGDPFQLPPVKGEGFFTNAEPDFMLEEIHRQARDNPIIQMSKRVREGNMLQLGRYGDSRVVPSVDIAQHPDAPILVGRKTTRVVFNEKRRESLGIFTELPTVGELLICLKNDHRRGLLNGTQWRVKDVQSCVADLLPLRVAPDEGGTALFVNTHAPSYNIVDPWPRRGYDSFDFGYAMTVHKAQGSQWPEVVLIDQASDFREHAARWLYTAITRAEKKITIARYK